MIKEFTANGYKYVLAGPVLTISKVKLNSVDISKYLSNNTKISWYDVSKNSGRDVTNADGNENKSDSLFCLFKLIINFIKIIFKRAS
ncbi:MAG: hypothetical protein ACI4VR_03040 [Bacilli bacterium]